MTVLVAETIELYVCNSCGSECEHESVAAACCPNVEELDFYECGRCGSEFRDEDEAKDCCLEKIEVRICCSECSSSYYGTTTEEIAEAVKEARECCVSADQVDRYRCGECEEVHNDEDDAAECHPGIEKKVVYECPNCTWRSEDKGKAMVHCQHLG